MEKEKVGGELPALLRDCYPELSSAELSEAQANFEEHVRIIDAIFQRLQNDPEMQEKFEKLRQEYRQLTSLDELRESGNLSALKYRAL